MGRTTTGHAVMRPRRRRWIVFLVVGLLIGGLAVGFLAKVYNPFGAELGTPLALVPEDADFVLSIPVFPEFIRRLPEGPVVKAMDRSESFGRFLQEPDIRKTGVVEAIRDAFRSLESIQAQVPLGLDLLGDISGRHVAVSGYVPRTDEEELRYMLVFQPESWKTLAGVNLLLDETLCGWFIEDAVGSEATIEHYRDMVQITPRDGRPLYITRLADAVLVSTEERQLSRIITAVQTSGVPGRVAPRFIAFSGSGDEDTGIEVVAKRDAADKALELQKTLNEIWGPEDKDLALSILPRLADEDLFIRFGLGEGVDLSVVGPEGDAPEGGLSSLMGTFDRASFLESAEEVLGMMPREAFGFVYLKARPGDVFRNFYERPALFSDSERELFDEELVRMEAFGSRASFFAAINELGRGEMSVVFFRQPRAPLIDRAQVGYALVIPLADDQRAIDLLSAIEQQVVASGGEGPLKELVPLERNGMRFWRLTVGPGVLDDDRVAIPGIALINHHLILTNFQPFLTQIPKVIARQQASLWEHPEIEDALLYVPRRARLAALLSYKLMTPWLEQSIDGWATSQAEPTAEELVRWANEAIVTLRARGIEEGTPQWEQELDRIVEHKKRAVMRTRRATKERRIRNHVGYFTEVLGGMGLHVAENDQGVGLALRIDLASEGDS